MFGGSPKCPICGKSVFFNERVRALGEDYHKSCFKCANCKKTLQTGQQQEHEDKLYCRPCHGKLFGAKGYGFGALNDTGLRKTDGDGAAKVDYATSDEVREHAEAAASPRGSAAAPKHVNVENRKSRWMPVSGHSSECGKCGKSVGFAEKLTALDRTWHQACFTCSSDTCKKRLYAGNYSEKDGDPYCKACYGRNFGPKGYGYGGAMQHKEPV